MSELVDFGAPSAFGSHHFYVEIPVAPRDAITLCEDYGFDGDESQRETTVCRAIIARELWTKIRDDARRDFNTRLKSKKLKVGRWVPGKIKLDRFLGRELCVLSWAVEHASPEECPLIAQKWLALRPEERWWLYSKTAAEAGLVDQGDRGWRKALYCALSDGTAIKQTTKAKPRLRKRKQDSTPGLFDNLEKGTI